ncbi:hypothetical protein ACJ73_09541, partial [Blastomyces percursus]
MRFSCPSRTVKMDPCPRWLFESIRNHSPGSLVSPARGFMIHPSASHIPVANFGFADAKIPARWIIGHFVKLASQDIIVPLSADHNGRRTSPINRRTDAAAKHSIPCNNANSSCPDTHLPNTIPFQFNYDADNPTDSAADIFSAYGTEFRDRVASILDEYSSLFPPGLGMIKDAPMPIPFRDESDVSGLTM